MKKAFAILLVIALSLIAMPAYASIRIGDSGKLSNDFVSEDGSIRYIIAEKKLILKDANIEYERYPIQATEGEIREIELIGKNTVTATENQAYGIYLKYADVRIYGSGSLKSTAGFTPLFISDGSLRIDGASVEIVQTDSFMPGVAAKGDIILTNGARLDVIKMDEYNNIPAIQASTGHGKIEVSGDSRITVSTNKDFAFYGCILDAEYVKLSDTSGIEIVSPAESRPAEDVYAASEVYLVNKKSDQNKNIFSIDRFTSAKDNRFTVNQTAEEDGRYKLVIQGEEVDALAEIPETGDSANLALYAAMLLLGAGLLIRMKKRGEA